MNETAYRAWQALHDPWAQGDTRNTNKSDDAMTIAAVIAACRKGTAAAN